MGCGGPVQRGNGESEGGPGGGEVRGGTQPCTCAAAGCRCAVVARILWQKWPMLYIDGGQKASAPMTRRRVPDVGISVAAGQRRGGVVTGPPAGASCETRRGLDPLHPSSATWCAIMAHPMIGSLGQWWPHLRRFTAHSPTLHPRLQPCRLAGASPVHVPHRPSLPISLYSPSLPPPHPPPTARNGYKRRVAPGRPAHQWCTPAEWAEICRVLGSHVLCKVPHPPRRRRTIGACIQPQDRIPRGRARHPVFFRRLLPVGAHQAVTGRRQIKFR